MFRHVISLCDPDMLYSLATEPLRQPGQFTSQTAKIPGLAIDLLAYDNHDPGNLPYGYLYEDLGQLLDRRDHDQLMFSANITSAMRGDLAGWRCSGLEVLRDEGVKFYFVHDHDRCAAGVATTPAVIGLRAGNFDHVRFLIWQPSAQLNLRLMGFNDARLIGRLVGAQVGLPEQVHHTVIDYWDAELSEAFQAAQPPEDRDLRARITTFINGEPQKMLEFPNLIVGPTTAIVTEF